jgi:hypothetical protein
VPGLVGLTRPTHLPLSSSRSGSLTNATSSSIPHCSLAMQPAAATCCDYCDPRPPLRPPLADDLAPASSPGSSSSLHPPALSSAPEPGNPSSCWLVWPPPANSRAATGRCCCPVRLRPHPPPRCRPMLVRRPAPAQAQHSLPPSSPGHSRPPPAPLPTGVALPPLSPP